MRTITLISLFLLLSNSSSGIVWINYKKVSVMGGVSHRFSKAYYPSYELNYERILRTCTYQKSNGYSLRYDNYGTSNQVSLRYYKMKRELCFWYLIPQFGIAATHFNSEQGFSSTLRPELGLMFNTFHVGKYRRHPKTVNFQLTILSSYDIPVINRQNFTLNPFDLSVRGGITIDLIRLKSQRKKKDEN